MLALRVVPQLLLPITAAIYQSPPIEGGLYRDFYRNHIVQGCLKHEAGPGKDTKI